MTAGNPIRKLNKIHDLRESDAMEICQRLRLPRSVRRLPEIPADYYGRVTIFYEAGQAIRAEAVQSIRLTACEGTQTAI